MSVRFMLTILVSAPLIVWMRMTVPPLRLARSLFRRKRVKVKGYGYFAVISRYDLRFALGQATHHLHHKYQYDITGASHRAICGKYAVNKQVLERGVREKYCHAERTGGGTGVGRTDLARCGDLGISSHVNLVEHNVVCRLDLQRRQKTLQFLL
jgi:hypothetical protein